MKRSVAGRIALLVGVALLMYAVAGASAMLQPQFTRFYVAGAAGIVAFAAGLLVGAIQLQDK
jgi:hypothetical protein